MRPPFGSPTVPCPRVVSVMPRAGSIASLLPNPTVTG